MLNMPIADSLSNYLNLQARQMQLTASNIANVDTPGYRTMGMDMDGEFARALDAHGSFQPGAPSEVQGLVARPDGNNVSMDREAMTMASTQLSFRTGIELLRHQFSMLSDAIKSDGR